jgi:hypothetical protein
MHTDEYEISMGREITLCRKLIRRLKESIVKKEKKYGMTTEEFLKGVQKGSTAEGDFRSWAKDHRDMQIWENRLNEYEAALRELNVKD